MMATDINAPSIAPTAAIASLPFAPELVIPATQAMFERYGEAKPGSRTQPLQ